MNAMAGVDDTWIEPLTTWAQRHSEIEAVYLFGSRVSGFSHKTGEPFRQDSDLDVGLRINGDDNGFTVWICDARGWEEEIAALGLSVAIDLRRAGDDDADVWPACQAYGECIYERPEMREFRVPITGAKFEIEGSIWRETGAMDFRPKAKTYVVNPINGETGETVPVTVVPVGVVRKPTRSKYPPYGVENHRLAAAIKEMVNGVPVFPIMAHRSSDDPDGFRFTVHHGYHRYYVSVALGFSHLPLWVIERFDPNA